MKCLRSVLVGKPEGNKPLGRYRCRREADIKGNLAGIASDGGDLFYLAQNREFCTALVNTVKKLAAS